MAQYEVLRPIELDRKLYLPKSDADAPAKARSAGDGSIIEVDASGVIELTPQEAKQMTAGQVKEIKAQKSEGKKKKD